MESGYLSNLDEWIKMQKNLLETLKELEKKYEAGDTDRLDLILATRVAFQHIMRTVKAFDQWLQDPQIIKHMPKEMLEDVMRTTWNILETLLELDIRHTSQFRELVVKLSKEGKLDPLIWNRPLNEEQQTTQNRRGTFMTM
ncbi:MULTISPECIES: DUF2153 domain-containing protein [Sulfolobaceae]|uniref:DUF2153 domain-containing protein n=3 Tax=Sulfurisphaera TaxID=69655 RepID=F9VMR1_SULTO|nr:MULTISPECIES: DUF2153 domain-containing protein [Sulfolobaceae]MBB5253217.1 hypothetical protein [Sulfurisphaera ohwakuensis]QGR15874.1 DUF2153 domain-containing protein [Sulfurisphaera ohwakuensis]QIW23074.1 DUF2153 domain-containing protein [Sulfolobus sp. S-194]BAK54207.1 hypothetical protein STK_02400 [Sulfurisphaera tokodaii str. 7]HII74361.1 DUF2153 domain-containing protein [Sulfurisphaera tokodaii]